MKRKKISINNNKDLKKFYRRLFIYKSVIYKNTLFSSSCSKIKDIVKALNIKNRKDRITFIYDSACFYADDYMKKQNPNFCGFENGRCHIQKYSGCIYKNGCCRNCYYQSDKGCRTSNLICKFFFCNEVKKRYNVVKIKDVKILKLFSFRQRQIIKSGYFISRESFINSLYIGSIIVHMIKSVILIITRLRSRIVRN